MYKGGAKCRPVSRLSYPKGYKTTECYMSGTECIKYAFDLYKDTEYRSFSQIFRFEACAAGASMASFRSGTEAGDAEPVRGIGASIRLLELLILMIFGMWRIEILLLRLPQKERITLL